MSEAQPPLADASALCVSCGLCCSGVLFADAKATPDETGRIRSYGLETFRTEAGADRFRLPCHHLSGGACTIYADRFSTCRKFKCRLLKRLEAGEVALADGQAAVARAKQLLAPVIAAEPGLRNVVARRALRREGVAALPATDRPAAGRLLLDTLVLDRFLDATFREAEEEQAAVDGVMRPMRGGPQQAGGGYLLFELRRAMRSGKADRPATLAVRAAGDEHLFEAMLARR